MNFSWELTEEEKQKFYSIEDMMRILEFSKEQVIWLLETRRLIGTCQIKNQQVEWKILGENLSKFVKFCDLKRKRILVCQMCSKKKKDVGFAFCPSCDRRKMGMMAMLTFDSDQLPYTKKFIKEKLSFWVKKEDKYMNIKYIVSPWDINEFKSRIIGKTKKCSSCRRWFLTRKRSCPNCGKRKDVGNVDERNREICKLIEEKRYTIYRVSKIFLISPQRVSQIYRKVSGRKIEDYYQLGIDKGKEISNKNKEINLLKEKIKILQKFPPRKRCENCELIYKQGRDPNKINVCRICGKGFRPHRNIKCQSSRGTGDYCSRKCYMKNIFNRRLTYVRSI